MSSSDGSRPAPGRRAVLALAVLFPLAACGFRPALAPGAPATGLFGRLRADDPADRDGVEFVARLEERLGRPAAPGWRLAWALALEEERLGLEAGVGETRAQVLGRLDWRLIPEGAEAPVAEGRIARFTGYSRTATPLAEEVAARDARVRLVRLLADALVTELTATAPDWTAAGASG